MYGGSQERGTAVMAYSHLVKHGGGSVVVQDPISVSGVWDLVKINGIMNKEQYCPMLTHDAIPTGRHVIGSCFIFQQEIIPNPLPVQ